MRVLLFSKESAGRSVGFVRCRIQFDTAGNAAFELDEDAPNFDDMMQRFRNLGWLLAAAPQEQASGSVVEDDASTEDPDDLSSDEVVEDDTGDAPIASSTSKPKTKNQKKHKR